MQLHIAALIPYCMVPLLYYGDTKILSDNFEPMKRYVDFFTSMANGNILPKDRYGDWLPSRNLAGWVREILC